MDLATTTPLNNGVSIPWVGLGVFQSNPGPDTENAVRWALEIGYRHIDTAAFYENEESVGTALRKSGVPREEVFITTKVWNSDQGYENTLKAFDESRRKLGVDTVDLYLVHWPIRASYKETWRALEKIYADGKARAIGVSNFLVHHLREIMQNYDVTPAVNQVEWHPFVLQKELLNFCKQNGIQFEAWSPMTRGRYLDNPVITEIADGHGKTPAQVLLRWDLQHEVVTIPKSIRRERIQENSEIFDFELSSAEMARLDALDENHRIGPHPDTIG